jgi:hypothetical protein
MSDEKERVTLSGKPPAEGSERLGAPQPIDASTGMHGDYWILSDGERARGFVRPVRFTYLHGRCVTSTTMGHKLAETYARKPSFYGATFCCHCKAHFPVSEFTWEHTDEIVGS